MNASGSIEESTAKSIFPAMSRLILGTSFWKSIPQAEADSLFDRYVELGGNTFDTALVYFDVEVTLGNWIEKRGNRDRIFIHAKGAHHETIRPPGAQHEYHRPRVNPDEIHRDIDETLRRLRTDYVDIFTLHRDDPDYPVESIVDCLADEQKAGRIRAFGASNWTTLRIQEANACAAARNVSGFVCSSPNLALAFPNEPSWPNCVTACDTASRRWYEQSRFPALVWSSLALGFFSGRYRPLQETTKQELQSLMSDRWTSDVVRVYYSDRNFERLKRAQKLGRKRGVTATQIALAWVLHQPMNVYAIVGPRTLSEISELFAAMSVQLRCEESRWLNLEA